MSHLKNIQSKVYSNSSFGLKLENKLLECKEITKKILNPILLLGKGERKWTPLGFL